MIPPVIDAPVLIWDTFLGCTALFLLVGLPVGFYVFCLYLHFIKLLPRIERQSETDLQTWAAQERLTLVSYRRVKLGQAGFLMPGLVEYRIVVEDSQGHTRSGWASFRGWRTPPAWVKVRWESESQGEQTTR